MSADAIERLDRIRARVRRAGTVRVAALAGEFAVSEMTIRRDLDTLANEGVVQRVHGGAVALGARPFAERYAENARAKVRIAEKLVPMVGEQGSVGFDASSTVERLAERVVARDLAVLTNGPETFATLRRRSGVTALLTGGLLDERSGSLVGPLAERAAGDVLLRRLFVGAIGVDPEVGTSEPSLEEAAVKRALADVAAEIVLAVDSSKLGVRAGARALALDTVDVMVTELDADHPDLEPYRGMVEIR